MTKTKKKEIGELEIEESKDMGCEISNRIYWIRRMRVFRLQIADFGLRNISLKMFIKTRIHHE